VAMQGSCGYAERSLWLCKEAVVAMQRGSCGYAERQLWLCREAIKLYFF
jgi:hypothetical protein